MDGMRVLLLVVIWALAATSALARPSESTVSVPSRRLLSSNQPGADSPAAALDAKAISIFYQYVTTGCNNATAFPKPANLADDEWSGLCQGLSGDHCSLDSVNCSAEVVVLFDVNQLPGKQLPIAKAVYATGDVQLAAPDGDAVAAVIDSKAISTFYKYVTSGCSNSKAFPKPANLTSGAYASLCGGLSGAHCSLKSVKCSAKEVVFYDVSQLPDKQVQVATGVYATGAVQLTAPTVSATGTGSDGGER